MPVHSNQFENMIDEVKQHFFNYSPKRNGLLSAIIQEQHPENGKKKPLITLCATRWVARIEAYDHVYASFKYTVFALEIMAHSMHHDECPEQFHGWWEGKTQTDASALLKAITDLIVPILLTKTFSVFLQGNLTAATLKVCFPFPHYLLKAENHY